MSSNSMTDYKNNYNNMSYLRAVGRYPVRNLLFRLDSCPLTKTFRGKLQIAGMTRNEFFYFYTPHPRPLPCLQQAGARGEG
jgi:hypothetical protein